MAINRDWYPTRLAELPPFHSTFAAQCTATGTDHGLTAGDIERANVDNILVTLMVDYDDALRGYVEAWTQWRNDMLFGDPDSPFTPPPSPPVLSLPDEVFEPGIRPRTRGFANTIKADADYTQAVGEDYGIVPVEPSGPNTPAILKATSMIDHDVALKLYKGGYSVIAVDMRRGGGNWTQIGISQTAVFVDLVDPVDPGTPEVREYRVQGMQGNNRVGDVSAIVSVVTTP